MLGACAACASIPGGYSCLRPQCFRPKRIHRSVAKCSAPPRPTHGRHHGAILLTGSSNSSGSSSVSGGSGGDGGRSGGDGGSASSCSATAAVAAEAEAATTAAALSAAAAASVAESNPDCSHRKRIAPGGFLHDSCCGGSCPPRACQPRALSTHDSSGLWTHEVQCENFLIAGASPTLGSLAAAMQRRRWRRGSAAQRTPWSLSLFGPQATGGQPRPDFECLVAKRALPAFARLPIQSHGPSPSGSESRASLDTLSTFRCGHICSRGTHSAEAEPVSRQWHI